MAREAQMRRSGSDPRDEIVYVRGALLAEGQPVAGKARNREELAECIQCTSVRWRDAWAMDQAFCDSERSFGRR
jgi:hypothetical protein